MSGTHRGALLGRQSAAVVGTRNAGRKIRGGRGNRTALPPAPCATGRPVRGPGGAKSLPRDPVALWSAGRAKCKRRHRCPPRRDFAARWVAVARGIGSGGRRATPDILAATPRPERGGPIGSDSQPEQRKRLRLRRTVPPQSLRLRSKARVQLAGHRGARCSYGPPAWRRRVPRPLGPRACRACRRPARR